MSSNHWIQFIKFGLVGVSNTAVSYAINIGTLLLLKGFRLSCDYIIANITAFLLSVLWSYYWNSRFVFKQKSKESSPKWVLLKTYLCYGFTGILLNNVLSTFWIYILGMSKYLAPLINLIISVPINFLLNKFWAYKDTE